MSAVTNDRLEANRITQTIASALDHVGAYGNWRICPNTHCERSEQCRMPHDCAGRNRNIVAAQVLPVVASAHQQITALTARVAELEAALKPFADADRAIGGEPGPFRFETGADCRLIARDDLRRAGGRFEVSGIAQIRHLSVLNYANGFMLWHYRASAIIDVVRSGFFAPVADVLGQGDMILVSASDGAMHLWVEKIDPVTVMPMTIVSHHGGAP